MRRLEVAQQPDQRRRPHRHRGPHRGEEVRRRLPKVGLKGGRHHTHGGGQPQPVLQRHLWHLDPGRGHQRGRRGPRGQGRSSSSRFFWCDFVSTFCSSEGIQCRINSVQLGASMYTTVCGEFKQQTSKVNQSPLLRPIFSFFSKSLILFRK